MICGLFQEYGGQCTEGKPKLAPPSVRLYSGDDYAWCTLHHCCYTLCSQTVSHDMSEFKNNFFVTLYILLLIDTHNTCTSTVHTTIYTIENLHMDVTLDCHNSQGT